MSFTLHQDAKPDGENSVVISVHSTDGSPRESIFVLQVDSMYRAYELRTIEAIHGGMDIAAQVDVFKDWYLNLEYDSATVGDFDGDGLLDIAFGGSEGVFWYRNSGDGASEPELRVVEGSDTIGIRSFRVESADFNNDGYLDLAVMDRPFPLLDDGKYELVIYTNDGKGQLGERRVVAVVWHCEDIKVADLDSDGSVDLFCHNEGAPIDSSPSELLWYRNAGDTFIEIDLSDTFNSSTRLYSIWDIFLEDVDTDGNLELMVSNRRSVMQALFDGEGQVLNFEQLPIFLGGYHDSRQDFADLDGDGDVDLVERAERIYYSAEGDYMFEDEVTWRENVDGVFQEKQLLAIVPRERNHTRPVHTGDLDGDGDLDIVISPWAWLESHVADGESPVEGDVNSDGTIDMNDFYVLAEHFGRTNLVSRFHGDVDENGVVDFTDFLMLSQYLDTKDFD